MNHDPRPGAPPRPGGGAVVGVLAFALVLGLALIRGGTDEATGPPRPEASAAASVPAAEPSGAPPAPLPRSRPTRLRIPAIAVDAPLTGVGLGPRGAVEVPPPEEENLAGWYEGAATPGARGTAVVVGHVDNREGPAVFYELGSLAKGDTLEVAREDGRTVAFTVYAVEVYEKAGFPSERVYGGTRRAELRVITCGGGYGEQTGYLGNVVVFARLTGVR